MFIGVGIVVAVLVLLIILAVVFGGLGAVRRGPPPSSGSRSTG